MLIPVILSGGSGTRLWPVSRRLFPKQFHRLTGPLSLLQQTAERVRGLSSDDELFVICNEEHRFLVAEQLGQLQLTRTHIVLEPRSLNTAPAIAIAAMYSQRLHGAAPLLVLPSDHLIADRERFQRAVEQARQSAEDGNLVTFGIVPASVETGYGYIKKGSALAGDNSVYRVERFLEKPDRERAQQFLQSGEYYWNSGMFLFRSDAFLTELQKWRPEIHQCCEEAIERSIQDDEFVRIDAEAFSKCPADSIDYAIMEHTQNAVMVPLDTVWSDIGSWSQLCNVLDCDESGNVEHGDVVTHEVSNSYIHSEGRLIAVVGIKDAVIVETDDAVLVAAKQHDQDVKKVVEKLDVLQRTEISTHKRVYRPWGNFQSLDDGGGFQVKRLVINPAASISLQLHHKRSEHWVVVRGEAHVTRGTETFVLRPNESTYIPKNTQHKLENKGNVPLEVVEVQTGSYLGEDDIVRFEDKYGRV